MIIEYRELFSVYEFFKYIPLYPVIYPRLLLYISEKIDGERFNFKGLAYKRPYW